MGFSSIDDLITEITTNGKFYRSNFQKISTNAAASAAGRWHGTFSYTGVPATGGFSGTAGVAVAMNKDSPGALFLNGSVSPDTRHLLNIGAFTPSTMPPATLILCDFLLYYPSCVVTGTPTTLDNTITLPRYTDGVGVYCFVEVQALLGATMPALTLTFRDQGDVARTGLLTAPVASAPISTCFASFGGLWLPFPNVSPVVTGVKKIDSYTLATGTTGTVAFVLAKPLATIPILAVNVASERDYLMQLPSLPRVYDNACLGFVMVVGGAMVASANLSGYLEMGWG